MSPLFDAIIGGAIRNRVTILLAAVALTAVGLWQVRRARLDALPAFTPPMVSVQAEAPGYGSSEVEQRVTAPLERQLLGIPGVTLLRSKSAAGLCVIRLTFADGSDIFRARQLVGERLAWAADELPASLPPPQIAPIVSPVGALVKFTYTVVGGDDDGTFGDLSRFVQWRVAPRLRAVPGVARVTVHGAVTPRVEVRPDPVRMISQGVSLSTLRDALARGQGSAAPGHVRAGAQRVLLRADTRWSIDDLGPVADAVVVRRHERPIRVRDVADVALGRVPAVGKALQDGRRAVYVQVDKLPWADTLTLTRRVEGRLAALDRVTPPGVRREAPVFRQADFIGTSLRSVGRAMFLGSLLVVVILLAFLGSPRVAGISLVALPLSMLAAVVVLLLRGVTINGMVLGGLTIAVGEVVDDAIVDVENIWRRLKQNATAVTPRPALEVIHAASVEVRGAVVYASLIIVVVLLPILGLGGLAGRIFSPLAQAYGLAILASLVVALTVTPALSALLLARRAITETPESALSRHADRLYRRLLARVGRRPGATLAVTLSMATLALAVLPLLGGGFLPEFREGVLIAEVDGWPGTSLARTSRLARRLDAGLRGPGGLPHVATRIGRATLDEDTSPVHRIEMDLELPPGDGDPEAAAAPILRQLSTVPGIRFSVDGFLGERINELLAGERAPIAVKLRGDDLRALRGLAARLTARLARIPGVESVRCRNLVEAPTTRILPAAAALSLAGALPAQLADAVAVSQQGLQVTEVTGPAGFRIPLVIAAGSRPVTAGALPDLPIWTARGQVLPLSALATLADAAEPASIQHEGGQRLVTVTVQARRGDVVPVARRIEGRLRETPLPPGVSWEMAGQAAERQRAGARLILTALVVLAAILVFLWMAFRSLVDALVIIAGIPIGLAGGVIAALFLRDGLSLAALIGFITLTGIISRNGIMLVAHKNHLRAAHPDRQPASLIVQAARERLRPILMTATTALGGLLPLALSLEAAGSELEAPMAVIVCGGLLTSTVLNLLAVPAFYLWRLRSSPQQAVR